MPGAGSPVTLRLASAQRKIRAFLDQLNQIETDEFPYLDGKLALDDIRKHFRRYLVELDNFPAPGSITSANALCSDINYDVNLYTTLLGLIRRSTNVRNAFEIQDPLKRIAQATIRSDIRLILSSEWDYIPSTYPMNADVVSSSVFVGIPAQESRYALPYAIAGHEIGHSVWRQHGVESRLLPTIQQAVSTAAESLGRSHDVTVQNAAAASAIRQAQEVFCDALGLATFGEAYLYAFEYLLAPGDLPRALDYPSVLQRNGYLAAAASKFGLHFDPSLLSNWIDSRGLPATYRELAAIADVAVSARVMEIADTALDIVQSAGLALPRRDTVAHILGSFDSYQPYNSSATLSEILTAGWLKVRAAGGLGAESDIEMVETLNELVLKSIEISDFYRLTSQC